VSPLSSAKHVAFELESIDRLYLNVYVPRLQREAGVAGCFRFHRRPLFASSALMDRELLGAPAGTFPGRIAAPEIHFVEIALLTRRRWVMPTPSYPR